jgi:hypothetical protein
MSPRPGGDECCSSAHAEIVSRNTHHHILRHRAV